MTGTRCIVTGIGSEARLRMQRDVAKSLEREDNLSSGIHPLSERADAPESTRVPCRLGRHIHRAEARGAARRCTGDAFTNAHQ